MITKSAASRRFFDDKKKLTQRRRHYAQMRAHANYCRSFDVDSQQLCVALGGSKHANRCVNFNELRSRLFFFVARRAHLPPFFCKVHAWRQRRMSIGRSRAARACAATRPADERRRATMSGSGGGGVDVRRRERAMRDQVYERASERASECLPANLWLSSADAQSRFCSRRLDLARRRLSSRYALQQSRTCARALRTNAAAAAAQLRSIFSYVLNFLARKLERAR